MQSRVKFCGPQNISSLQNRVEAFPLTTEVDGN